ncbi:hypothetical protein SLEP1_g7464 [Rubroshorea leprosula]|uniref:Uncharacterized protein n=1 Tax=Rubroshorea leprosula TaxID=152421 RepID=A0AAV5I9F0_9ROSI|nr:hypothetical protein SLEP1_g7464 [Rubroshorea leprosula]
MSSSDPKTRPKPGSWPPAPDAAPIPPSSWAKRTGFRPKFSGETNASDSGQLSLPPRPREPDNQPDLEAGRAPLVPVANGVQENQRVVAEKDQKVKKRKDSDGQPKGSSPGHNGTANANGHAGANGAAEPAPRRAARTEEAGYVLPQSTDDDGFVGRPSHMIYELRDTPGLGQFLLLVP